MAQAWCGKMEKRADGGFYYCQLLYGHKEPHNFDESLAPPKPLTKDQELESLRAQLLEARADVAALLLKLEYMADQGMKSSMYGFAGVVAMAKALREVLAKPSPASPSWKGWRRRRFWAKPLSSTTPSGRTRRRTLFCERFAATKCLKHSAPGRRQRGSEHD